MAELVVIGAGPAGLMAALEASRAGHRCTLVEAAPHVGGMAGSFEVAGQRVDYGSHRLHPATPAPLLAQLQRLLGDDLQVRPRSGRIRLGGTWVGFPLQLSNLVRNLKPSFTARLLADSARSMIGRPGEAASFGEEVRHRFGPTVADEFYAPYARKLYGIHADDLDPELARRRIAATSPADIARRILRASRPLGRTFLYPRRGYGQIAERLAEAAVDARAEIETATPVTGIKVGADQVVVDVGRGRRIAADVVLSTLPLTVLAGLAEPAPPVEVRTALAEVRTRAMLLVYLVLDRPQYTEFDAHYVPGPECTIARLSEPKNYRDGDDPPGTTVLCAEIPCWATDEIYAATDDDLGRLVADDLQRLGLPAPRHVATEVRRPPSVYPVYDLAGRHARAVVDDWIRHDHGRLLTLGRQGLRVIDNLHHVLAMGAAAVESVGDDGTVDRALWRRHLDQFATHTVED